MDPRCHHESYRFSYDDLGFPGSYVDHRQFDQYYLYGPTYQTTPTTIPSTQHATVLDIRGGLHQTPAMLPMISSFNPTFEGGYSLAGSQPQVSPAAVPTVEVFT